MDVFEAELDEIVTDGPQLISEALQLENFIFSTKPYDLTFIDDSQLSDWALRFCTIRSFDDKGNTKEASWLQELNTFIVDTRKKEKIIADKNVLKLNMITKKKGETVLNRPNILRKFCSIDAVLRLKELDDFKNENMFSPKLTKAFFDECSGENMKFD
jgi:hypothetical protein